MLVVESRCRSILLADRVNASGITQRFDIRRTHLGAESICRGTPTTKGIIDNSIRSG
jgi:hypothetical protein